jgi:hypothetical protein
MRRLIIPVTVALAAGATGCLYEREAVRDDRRVENPPPPAPPDYSPAPADTGYQSYQSEAPPPPPAGSDVASEAAFYERLSPYGYWTFVAPYGRVWVPAVGWGWRPYYYGRWVLTDWGWTFVSDDPWGWAGYHYGRWNWAVGIGWYWIPGTVWAPAWVSWRYGGGFVTWCPLGPPGVVFGYRHPAWVAVSDVHFTRPIAAVAVPSQRTFGVVTQARPLTGPHATIGRGGSFGPPVASVARATGQQIRPIAAAQVVRPRPTTTSIPRDGAMRSPVQPRARIGAVRPVPPAHPGDGSRAYPPRPSAAPRGSGPSGGPRASPPPASPPSGGGGEHGGGHGGGPHATSGRGQAR